MKIDQLEAKTKPSLRFPNHLEEWSRKEFSALFLIKRTNSYSRDDLNYLEGSVKNIHYGDIHTRFNSRFDILAENVPFLNSEIDATKIENDDYCINGDVVMADASEDFADVGKAIEIVNLAEEKVVAGLHTLLIRPKDQTFTVGFLAYLFQSWKIRLQIMTYSQGAKVLGISRGWLSRIYLDFPSPDEQRKIVALLSAVDDKIGQLSRKKESLTNYKKGVMQQIFDQKVRFKDDNGNSFPDWEEKKLGEVSRINPKTGPLPSEFTYIDLESVEDGSLNKEEFIRAEDAPSRAQRVLSKGDILFQVVRPYQKNNFLFDRDGDYVASTGYAQIRAKINNRFLFQTLLTFNFVKDVVRRCTGTSYPAINSDDLSKIAVKIPSRPEQEKIGGFLTAIDSKIDLVNIQLEKTKTFKKSLLQQMFV